MDCRNDCAMYDQADETDEEGQQIGPEQSCLQRVKVATEIDYYIAATEALENIPQAAEPTVPL